MITPYVKNLTTAESDTYTTALDILGSIDTQNERGDRVPTISRFFGIVIMMYCVALKTTKNYYQLIHYVKI